MTDPSASDALTMLVRSNPRASPYWIEEALADLPPAPRLAGSLACDVCVVGGGYTGLWTAIRVKELEPSARVILLEGSFCGCAASGRNGGFALSWWPKIETLVDRFGSELAFRLARQSAAAIEDLASFCEREGIEAHIARHGWLWTATSRAQVGAWDGALRASAQAADQPFVAVSGDEIRDRIGSAAFLGGVFDASAATLQPAALTRGLRRAAERRGVELFEWSPVTRVDRESGAVHVDGGRVEARAIVLAMGASLPQVRGLGRAVVALSSRLAITEPIPDLLQSLGWRERVGVTNSRLMVESLHTTHDDRVVFGHSAGELSFRNALHDRFGADLGGCVPEVAMLHRLYPQLRDVRITHVWGGAVDRSSDGLPFFGRLPGRVPALYGAGYSGNGLVPALIGGRILASSALGLDDEWSSHALASGARGRFPPEPIRFLGGNVVRRAVRRKEERENRDLPVGPLTRRVAALAPSGFFKRS